MLAQVGQATVALTRHDIIIASSCAHGAATFTQVVDHAQKVCTRTLPDVARVDSRLLLDPPLFCFRYFGEEEFLLGTPTIACKANSRTFKNIEQRTSQPVPRFLLILPRHRVLAGFHVVKRNYLEYGKLVRLLPSRILHLPYASLALRNCGVACFAQLRLIFFNNCSARGAGQSLSAR